MDYELECEKCEHNIIIRCSITDHETLIKPGRNCPLCEGHMRQVFNSVYDGHASRESFPKGWNEHIAHDPVFVRDKIHAREIAAQHGNVSKWVENDC